MVKSINYSQEQIIKDILFLHVPTQRIDCDATYGKGKFYNNIQQPTYKYDINPQTSDTVKADCRALPLKDNTLNCIMFDPPFLASTGKSLNIENDNSNIMAHRFGIYKTETELHQFYVDSMREFYRVLKPNGILIFKCQDKVSSAKQYFSHVFIINEAIKLGYYPKDLFILLAKSRLVAEWQTRNQKNARKFHCYFLVFEKSNRKITYR